MRSSPSPFRKLGSRFCATTAFVLCAVSAWAQAAFTLKVDRDTGVYASGEEAVFSLQRQAPAEAKTATMRILRNNVEQVHTETIAPEEASRTVRFKPSADGWYTCAITVSGDKKPAAMTGVVFNTAAFKPSMAEPADFDTFWNAQRARLSAEKAVPKLEPLTPGQRALEETNPDHQKKITSLEKQGWFFSNLEIACLDLKPVRAYYAKPADAAPKAHPAILFFRAAGVEGGWCRSSLVNTVALSQQFNALVVDMNAHGMLNGQPQSYYDELAKGELKGYQNQGKESRDRFYFLGMFLRLKRALDFLAEQPEWDGKHLICVGVSQGGAQALAAAGLDPRVTAVVATVPGMCDITGRVAGGVSGWPGLGDAPLSEETTKAYIETVRYSDAVHLSARSKAATLMTVGLVDTTCSPPGVYAAFNALTKSKRIIPLPDKGHHALSTASRELKAQYDAFIREQANN